MTGRSRNADGPSGNGPAGGTFSRSLKAIRKEREQQQQIDAKAASVQAEHSVLLPELAAKWRRLEAEGYSASKILRQPAFRRVIGKIELCQPEPHDAFRNRKIAGYELLKQHLISKGGDTIIMTLTQIEKVIGYKLPKKARQQPGWWSNEDRDVSMYVQCKAWRDAGFDAHFNGQVIFRARSRISKKRR